MKSESINHCTHVSQVHCSGFSARFTINVPFSLTLLTLLNHSIVPEQALDKVVTQVYILRQYMVGSSKTGKTSSSVNLFNLAFDLNMSAGIDITPLRDKSNTSRFLICTSRFLKSFGLLSAIVECLLFTKLTLNCC